MRNKLLKFENLIKFFIVVVLVLFASTEYGIKNVIGGLLVVLGMFILGACIVRIYLESQNYMRTNKWELSTQKTLLYISIIFLTSLLFFFLLSDKMMKYSFLSVGVILLLLFVYDIVVRMFRKLF